jgi:DNA-binding FadR family transcriptional regulator
VRQGTQTVVLDPDRAANMRLLGLEIELMPTTPERLAAFVERQVYSGAALLEAAERRIDPCQVDELEAITELLAQGTDPDTNNDRFKYVRAYWMMIAVWTKNRFFVRETAWYFELLEKNAHLRSSYGLPPEHLTMLYHRLNAKLRDRQGAAIAYLEMVREIGTPLPHGAACTSSADEVV